MSETETLTGTLTRIGPNDSDTLEEAVTKLLISEDCHTTTEYDDTVIEILEDLFYKEYIIINDIIYKIEMKNKDPYEDIFEASKADNGTISFTVQYYNGRYNFNEAIEEAFERNDI